MRIVLFVCALTMSGIAAAQAPSDAFGAGGVLIVPSAPSITGSTASATAQLGEAGISRFAYGKSVWWKLNLINPTQFNAKTQGSAFDTTLAVYKGANLTEAMLVAGSDDVPGGNWSEVDVALSPGTYFVALDGFGGAAGNFTFSYQMSVGGAAAVLPPNDGFANAAPITAREEGNLVRLDNRFAGVEAGEPGSGSRSLWYRYTTPRAGAFQVNVVGAQFDSIVEVYSGNALGGLTLLGANDDVDNTQGNRESRVVVAAGEGDALRIRVASFGNAPASTFGEATLSITSPKQTEIPGINSTYSGLWGNPLVDNGQGVMVEIARHPNPDNPNQLLFFTWYLYDPTGNGAFVQGNAEITPSQGVTRQDITFSPIIARGVPLAATPVPGATTRTAWGSITLRFVNCNTIRMTYTPSIAGWGPEGTVNLRRAIARGLGAPCS